MGKAKRILKLVYQIEVEVTEEAVSKTEPHEEFRIRHTVNTIKLDEIRAADDHWCARRGLEWSINHLDKYLPEEVTAIVSRLYLAEAGFTQPSLLSKSSQVRNSILSKYKRAAGKRARDRMGGTPGRPKTGLSTDYSIQRSDLIKSIQIIMADFQLIQSDRPSLLDVATKYAGNLGYKRKRDLERKLKRYSVDFEEIAKEFFPINSD